MKIEKSTASDINEIFRLYRLATDFQKSKLQAHWPEFDRGMVETEIKEGRQWKMMSKDQVACVWAITFSDPQIWEEANDIPSVYIHRIAANPDFRGQKLVVKIIEWAKKYGRENHKRYIRMDTIGYNGNLIGYYTKCGFDFLGLSQIKDAAGLPKHYHNATVSLFQMETADKS